MNIYEALEADHRMFEQKLDELIAASKSGDDRWKTVLNELRREVIAHAHAEEAVLYNAMRADDADPKLVAHSFGEHATSEAELRTLGLAAMIDTTWTSLAEKLAKDLRHHIEEEESKVFAAARKVISKEEAEEFGAAFLKLKERMLPDGDSALASSIDLMANLLPPKLSARFREVEAERERQRARAA